MPAAAFIAASATGANPRGSGAAVSSVVTDGGEPSLTAPLLVVAAIALVVATIIVWWWRLGGWSPAQMTVALQLTGREVDLVGEEIGRAPCRPPGAVAAHQRAVAALPAVLRRWELAVVHDAIAQARHELALSANSQHSAVEPTSDPVPESLS